MAANKSLNLAQKILLRLSKSTVPGFNVSILSPHLKLISAKPDGTIHYQWKVDESHLNRGGKIHGGLIAGILDLATSISVMSMENGGIPASTDLNFTFIRPAAKDDILDIHTEVSKKGKNLAFTQATILNSDGNVVATGKQTGYIIGNMEEHIKAMNGQYR